MTHLLTASTVLLSLLSGCATPAETVVSGGEETGSIHGYLSVERTSPWGAEGLGAKEVASATFLRVQEGTDPGVVAKLVGAIPELPPEGTCWALDAMEPTTVPLRTLSPVELLRVGEVVVRSETTSTRLVTRAYPDVAHLLSGVVYTSSGRELPGAQGRVSFEVGGAEAVPGFTLEVPMPPPISSLMLDGVEVGDEQDWLSLGDTVELQWAAAEEDVTLPPSVGVVGPDRFFVDLSVLDGKKTPKTLRCSGGAKARLVAPLQVSEQTQSVTVTAHRLRTVRLSSPALAGGEVRLDAARSTTVRLREGDAR
ncbi:MAG: hypothetical protein RMJ98_02240 [Myxococcales bacterium]|nr:hypothetical protein [Myxococcales bacterium]